MAVATRVRNRRATCLYFLLNSQCDLKLYWEKRHRRNKAKCDQNQHFRLKH